MPITFVGSLSSGVINGGAPSVTLSTTLTTTGGGSGGVIAAGDYLIAIAASHISRAAGSSVVSGGTGTSWASQIAVVNGTDGAAAAAGTMRVRVYTSFSSGTGAGTVTATNSNAGGTANAADGDSLLILVFRGVDPTTPLDGVTPTTA